MLSSTDRRRNALALAHDKLALKIANRLQGSAPLERDDLVQLCRIGLLKAIDRFDASKGVAFSSFAVPYIQGEVAHYLRDHFGMVKIPRRAFEASASVRRTQKQLEAKGRTIDALKIAQAMGMSRDRWEWTAEAVQRKPLTNLDDCLHLGVDDDDLEGIERAKLRDRAMLEVAKLPAKSRNAVIEHFFGQRSISEIAKAQGQAPEAIQALIDRALAHLNRRMQEQES